MNALMELEGIGVRFGGVIALENVGLSVAVGELLGLIGPNGAGKTTLMRVITGVVRPKTGRTILDGQEISNLPTHRRVKLGLGLSHQIVRPFRSMTPLENVMLAAGYQRTGSPLKAFFQLDRGRERKRAMHLLDTVGIAKVADSPPNNLPLGMLKRLEVARALALDPILLLLDEPLAGLNQAEAKLFADTVRRLNEGGMTIIMIEHNLREVMRICHRLVVLDNGRCIGEGEPRAVMENPVVRTAYLGKGPADAEA